MDILIPPSPFYISYVIAPNQDGEHANGRRTFGDSMIVDPWGSILDRVELDPGFAIAGIDLEHLTKKGSRILLTFTHG